MKLGVKDNKYDSEKEKKSYQGAKPLHSMCNIRDAGPCLKPQQSAMNEDGKCLQQVMPNFFASSSSHGLRVRRLRIEVRLKHNNNDLNTERRHENISTDTW